MLRPSNLPRQRMSADFRKRFIFILFTQNVIRQVDLYNFFIKQGPCCNYTATHLTVEVLLIWHQMFKYVDKFFGLTTKTTDSSKVTRKIFASCNVVLVSRKTQKLTCGKVNLQIQLFWPLKHLTMGKFVKRNCYHELKKLQVAPSRIINAVDVLQQDCKPMNKSKPEY